MADWDSKQYLKFEKERTRPSVDLIKGIEISPKKILDVGCGPGNSTASLAKYFKDAYIIGIDSSSNMIEAAQNNYPEIDFMMCDASNDLNRVGENYDLVFSNACIQWIPNHDALLKNFMSLLVSGGVMAVQIPINYKEPIHTIINEVSSMKKWNFKNSSPRPFYTCSQSDYYDILSNLSTDFSIWETIYYHQMKEHNDIMEWYKGTGLRPYLDALPEEQVKEFEKEVFDKVVRAYPKHKNGDIIFRFPRLFFTAVK